jgi:hypothetical protein
LRRLDYLHVIESSMVYGAAAKNATKYNFYLNELRTIIETDTCLLKVEQTQKSSADMNKRRKIID